MRKAVIDIDGVLNYYPNNFINFVNQYANIKAQTLQDVRNNLTYNVYKKMKEDYRVSDWKHNADLRTNSLELINYLRKNDYLIIIITSRKLFDGNQLEYTIKWLNKNNIKYDYLYMSEKKDFVIYSKFKSVDLVVEDSMDNLQKILKICPTAKCYNVINKENENITDNRIKKIKNLNEIIEDLEKEKICKN